MYHGTEDKNGSKEKTPSEMYFLHLVDEIQSRALERHDNESWVQEVTTLDRRNRVLQQNLHARLLVLELIEYAA